MHEASFLSKCLKGDRRIWDEFVFRYARLIYSCIRQTLVLKGMHDDQGDFVDDIFQEVFLSLVRNKRKKLKTFKGNNGCSFASWLRQVTVNLTIDEIRKKRYLRSKAPLDQEEAEEKIMTYTNSEPGRLEMIEREKRRSLIECIKKMGTEEKFFMELHLNQALRLEEMRKVLRLSRGMIDMRKSRIIAKLRQCFQDKGFELNGERKQGEK